MTANDLSIQPLSRAELDLALDWAAAEGWNPGLFDADAFHAADPEGFLLGRLGDEPVAVISDIRYGQDFGFLGFYIVKPERRGRGHGWRIWQAAMARLAGRNVGLDGVLAQQDNYRRSGFRLAHRNMRYQCLGTATVPTAPAAAGARIVPLTSLTFETVAAYDRAFFPSERSTFLRPWIAQPRSLALGLLRQGRLAGYGVLRTCRSGYKIGPLFADTPAAADALFCALCEGAQEGAPVFLDVPGCNPAALALAGRHGLELVFETARMYTGPAPDLALERTYGITSFELG